MNARKKKLSPTKKREKTMAEQTERNKVILLENLTKHPSIQMACQKSGVGRSTYYKWFAEDQRFKENADKAKTDAKEFINDMAESQLIKAIGNGNMTAIIYWLKNNHTDYTDKVRYLHEHEHTHYVELDDRQKTELATSLVNTGLMTLLAANGTPMTGEEIRNEYAVASPNRLLLLLLISHFSHCTRDLMADTGLSQTLISHYLTDLLEEGLVEKQRLEAVVDYFVTEKGRQFVENLQKSV